MMKAIVQAFVATLLWFGALGAASAQTSGTPPQLDPTRVEAFMSGAIRQAMRDDRVVGASAAVVDRNGVVMARGYGRISADGAADADTLFRIGSISKTFTWIALMQLVEAGRVSLDEPANAYLPPELQIPNQGFDQPVLVRHLMTHSAGFEDSALGHLFVNEPARVSALRDYLTRYRVQRVRPPGALSVYSNYGVALAGAIIEHVSGEDYASYVEAHVLRPLGITNSTFREPYSADIASANGLPTPASEDAAARISQGFRLDAGMMQAASFEYITQIAPAGGMSASANDMAAYMSALLDPARLAAAGVLREETARRLNTPIFANDDRLGAWRHGFMSYDLGGGRWAFGHGGDTLYQHSEMVISPELGVGLFVVINSTAMTRAPGSIAEAFVTEFFPTTASPRAENVGAAESTQFAGSYRDLRRPYARTERALFRVFGVTEVAAADNGDLIVAGGLGPERFYPIGEGIYQHVDGAQRMAFREVDGVMRMFDPYGLSPADRIGFFEGPNWLGIVGGLGFVLALWGVIAGIRRLIAQRESAAALVFDGLCLMWLVAFVTLLVALASWLGPDQGAVVFNYPGALFPIACWLLLVAALATPIALAAALFLVCPKDWSWLRWTRAGLCVVTFGALAATLCEWGFLGFSHF